MYLGTRGAGFFPFPYRVQEHFPNADNSLVLRLLPVAGKTENLEVLQPVGEMTLILGETMQRHDVIKVVYRRKLFTTADALIIRSETNQVFLIACESTPPHPATKALRYGNGILRLVIVRSNTITRIRARVW